MKIVLLICDQFPGILPYGGVTAYEQMFERVLLNADGHSQFTVCQTWQGELPAVLNSDDIYLISGSTSDSYGMEDWISALRDWIRKAYSYGCKLSGICFGHQIIAEALGGKTVHSENGWGTGIRQSRITDDDFAKLAGVDSYSLVCDHHDQVATLPHGATLVSTSSFCPNESFRIGRQVLTFQGHPEFTNDFIRHWIEDCAPDEPEQVKATALHSLENLENQGTAVAGWLLRFFE